MIHESSETKRLRGIRSSGTFLFTFGVLMLTLLIILGLESLAPVLSLLSTSETESIQLSESFESVKEQPNSLPSSSSLGSRNDPSRGSTPARMGSQEHDKVSLGRVLLNGTTRTWRDVNESENYVARHECSFVQAGKRFYMFGGRETARRVDSYHFESNTWSRTANTPMKFNHFQATEYQGLIWVIATFEQNKWPNEPPAVNIHVYDPANNVWMTGPAIPSERRRGASGVVVYNDKFYVIGGNTMGHHGGFVPWFDEYDPYTNSWTTLADAPHSRDHFHAAVAGDKLYAIGGRRTSQTNPFGDVVKEVDVYDFTSGGWLSTGLPDDLPSPRAASAVAVIDGNIMVMGGESGNQTAAYDEVDELDTSTGKWSALPSMNHPRHGTQCIVSGHAVYITGGSPIQGGGNQRYMEVYGSEDDHPTGVRSTKGVLSIPSTVDVQFDEKETIFLKHVDGNQGVIVQSVSLSGSSASEFTLNLPGNTTVPFLVGKGSSVAVVIEFTGTVDCEVQLDVAFSQNEALAVTLKGSPFGPIRSNAGVSTSHTDGSLKGLPFGPIRINAGASTAHTDGNGITWAADSYFQSGNTWVSSASMTDNSDGNIYLSERFGSNLKYQIPNIPSGEYNVTLHLAENWISNLNGRVFNVFIEGVEKFSKVDIFKEAGGRFLALTKTTTVAVSDGTLDIKFTRIKQHPKVSALVIERVQRSSTSQSSEPSMFPSASISPSSEPSHVPSRMSDRVPASGTEAFEPLYINAGGSAHIDSDSGIEWAADSYFQNGKLWVSSGTMTDNSNGNLYLSERFGTNLMYQIPNIPNGDYIVTLHLAENWVSTANGRVFSVSMEGEETFSNVDIFKEAGGRFRALTKTATVEVLDGTLNIDFAEIKQRPKLSGISIKRSSGSLAGVVGSTTEAPSQSPSVLPSTTPSGMPSAFGTKGSITKAPSLSPSRMPSTETPSTSPSGTPTHSPSGMHSADSKGETNEPLSQSPLSTPSLRSAPPPFNLIYDTGIIGEDTAMVTGITRRYGVLNSVSINGTESPEYFRTHRYGSSFTYTIQELAAGASYIVSLGFAETYWRHCKVGKRIFDVHVNGNVVNPDLDVFREVGCNTALIDTYLVKATYAGKIEIDLVAIADNAMISLIQISSENGAAGNEEVTDAPTRSPSGRPSTRIEGASMTETPSQSPSGTPSHSPSGMPTTEAPSQPPTGMTTTGSREGSTEKPSYSLSGMPSSTSTPPPRNRVYDTGMFGEDTSMVTGITRRYGVLNSVAIKGTDSPQYFRTHRYGGSFTYTIQGLASGESYVVSLGFAETFVPHCSIGKRIIVISLNGNVVNPDLDVFKEAGCNAAFIDTYSVKATYAGKIEIGLDSIANNAMISLIHVESANE